MSEKQKGDHSGMTRREFVQASGMTAAGMVLASQGCGPQNVSSSGGDIPCRTLGRTKQSVTSLAMESWLQGFAYRVDISLFFVYQTYSR